MDVKARAAYAWGRIVSLFSRKKPDIEVEWEEFDEPSEDSTGDSVQKATSREAEAIPADEIVTFEPMEPLAPPEEAAPQRGDATDAPPPSRMTEEYKAWLREQMEADETRTDKMNAHEEAE